MIFLIIKFIMLLHLYPFYNNAAMHQVLSLVDSLKEYVKPDFAKVGTLIIWQTE